MTSTKLPEHLQELLDYDFNKNPNYSLKQYVLVRTDKAFTLGKLLVHAAHASSSAVMFEWQKKGKSWAKSDRIKTWFNSGKCQAKIVCAVKDVSELKAWIAKAWNYNAEIPLALIPDGGTFQVDEQTIIACAIGPVWEEEAVELGLKELKLY